MVPILILLVLTLGSIAAIWLYSRRHRPTPAELAEGDTAWNDPVSAEPDPGSDTRP